jgi:hypothetical protein
MADAALENAFARRRYVSERIEKTVEEIDGLIEQLNKQRSELTEIDRFIHMWHEMAGIQAPPEVEQMRVVETTGTTKRIRPKNPDREVVADACVNFIREAGRPLSRAELFERLRDAGIQIRGKDPEMVLSTMLWRTKDKITRLKGGGYWPASEPLPNSYVGDLV